MPSIKVLTDTTINKIAAGEVVERPISVVRELVDNAIDAGASKISVSVLAGGKDLIQVVDDGVGMQREDALLAFERHATSKISAAEDLDNIETKGFRGEALAAIAAVSKVYLKTRSTEDAVATVVQLAAGELRNVKSESGNTGTAVEVRNLFFNVPARKKFLKSPQTEVAKIKTWLESIAMAHPAIEFKLLVDEKEKLNLTAVSSAVERAEVYFPEGIVTKKYSKGDMELSACVNHPSRSAPSAGGFILIVNNRAVSYTHLTLPTNREV